MLTPSGRTFLLLALALTAAACSNDRIHPAPTGSSEPPLSLLVTHEEKVVRPDGVTQSARFQERVLRADGRVWVERVLDPRVALHHDDHGPDRHVHDWSTATRLFTKGAGEDGRLQFVLPDHKELVDVVPTEYDSVGFYPVWSELARLIDARDLASLKPSGAASKVAGARWLETADGERFVRVLWSDVLTVALEIEAGRSDGAVIRRLKAEIQRLPTRLPWEDTAGFALKDVNDFRD
ncbi:hypothetical protein [Vulgatibacter incomptus]|uniref:Lipoprotein n=1 Tax=Vulgatibacter incomptus TaxID=1391653 RepID=A0A0K1PI45_9BACT|nr:hypothetical protein [Vulgatibacter incomptus]AKU93200.1 hypothetical protein AKJ08_3587 [Vulgatibacter incomptus]